LSRPSGEPGSASIRRELVQANIERTLVARHFHLSSPLHGRPVCDPTRILFVAGEFDSIAPPAEIEAITKHGAFRTVTCDKGISAIA
jgi:hypothetical protein